MYFSLFLIRFIIIAVIDFHLGF